MEKKRSIIGIAIGITFICFGLLSLFNYMAARTSGRPQLFWNILAVVYIIIGFTIFRKWNTLKYWQKGAFTGILVRLIIIGLIGSYIFLPIARSMSNWEYYSFKFFDVISSPFRALHNKLIVSPRAVESGMHVYKHWEIAICTLLDILYACIVGGVIGMLIEKRKSSPAPK